MSSKQSNDKFLRIVIDSIPDPIMLKDKNGCYLMANKALADLYNTTPQAMVGKDDSAFGVPIEMSDFFRKSALSIMKNGETEIVLEDTRDANSGEIRHYKSIKKPLIDQAGNHQVLVIAQEITDIIKTQEQIAKSEQRLQNVLKATQEGIWDWYIPTGEVSHNQQWSELLGYDTNEIAETLEAFFQRIFQEDKEKVLDNINAHLRGEIDSYYSEHRMVRKNGDVFWVRDKGRIVEFNDDGHPLRVMGSFSDITSRKIAEEKLELAANVFKYTIEGIIITDENEIIIDVNDAFTKITGYTPQEVVGKTPRILRSTLQSTEFYAQMWKRINTHGSWRGEIWNKHKDGTEFAEMLTISTICDPKGIVRKYVAFISDITDIKQNERYLEHIAHHDPLTKLPNRILLSDRLNSGMIRSHRNKQSLAVIYLDLDGFKEINDVYGHQTGDELLILISKRMEQSLRESDTLARFGGDEFVAVLFDLHNTSASFPMIDRLLEAVSKPIPIENIMLHISASIGITFYPQNSEADADQLLRQADQAMYQAKLSGKNRYCIFDVEHDHHERGKHVVIENIRSALIHNEFVLYYQPKVNMKTGNIKGFEALIRWIHPEKGLIPPLEFLPFIESHPLSIDIGEWVIKTALQQLRQWSEQGLETTISVNVGAYQLLSSNFPAKLREALHEYSCVDPSKIEIEILETSTLENLQHAVQIIQECKIMGIKFALDDFGTGYSSLTYLKQLPVEVLKIDQTFVRGMLEDPDDLSILEGILGMGSAFRKEIIAEGVETIEHGEMLLLLGCELGQGYGIAKPMPPSEIMTWHKTWKPNPVWLDLAPINSHDFPLLFASIGHRAWINTIEKYVTGVSSNYPNLSYEECHFGKWLASEGSERYGLHSRYQELSKEHLKIHTLAKELLYLNDSGEKESVPGKLKTLYQSRDSLLNILGELRHKKQP